MDFDAKYIYSILVCGRVQAKIIIIIIELILFLGITLIIKLSIYETFHELHEKTRMFVDQDLDNLQIRLMNEI